MSQLLGLATATACGYGAVASQLSQTSYVGALVGNKLLLFCLSPAKLVLCAAERCCTSHALSSAARGCAHCYLYRCTQQLRLSKGRQADDLPPPQLGSADTLLQVGWHSARGELVTEHTIRLPRNSTVQQVLDEVKQAVNADPQAELRMLEIFQNKIFSVSVSSQWLPVFHTKPESMMGSCHYSMNKVSLWVQGAPLKEGKSCYRGRIQCWGYAVVLTGQLQ